MSFVRLVEIRPIKKLRHGHASCSASRRDFSNQLEDLPTLPTRKQSAAFCESATLSRAAPELGNGKYQRPEALLQTSSLRLNIIGAFLDLSPGKLPTIFIDKTEPRDKAMILIEH